jgi:CRISPR-associated protein Csx10
MNLCVEIEVKTDACLGGGDPDGVGGVDTATETDADGMPVLRGRTLKGLLVEEAAAILEMAGGPGALIEAASVLFGDPGRHGSSSLLSFADGSVAPVVREAFKDNGWDVRALTCVRRQTAIDRNTGAARTGSLRAARLIRAGVVLRCPVRSARDLTPTERALLAACVASIRRIGLHRNEGWGRVRCRLRDDQGADRTGEWLAGLDMEAPSGGSVEPRVAPPADRGVSPPSASPGRTVVELDIQLERPLVLADRAAGDWVTNTLPYLPGSALLGACAARWLARTRCDDPSIDEPFRRLFLDGSVRWLNAYPLDGEVRALPAPRSWRIDDPESESSAQVLDLAHPDAWERREAADPGHWKPLPAAIFEVTGAERIRLVRPRTMARLHHERDREVGRSRDGELFVHDALSAGQRFRGAVLCEIGADAEIVHGLLQGAVLDLGRSRTASYGGGARITDIRVHAGESWSEAESAPSARVLVLASDYLGHNARGTSDPAAMIAELADRLGLARSTLEKARSYVAHRVVHGSVGRWQMPRPVEVAVAAGSVVVLPPDVTVDRDKLADVVWRGLGGRRAEGFGRVVAMSPWEEEAAMPAYRARTASTVHAIHAFTGDDRLLARVRRWVAMQTLRTAMIEDATAVGATLRPVSPSLVARVRQEVRAAGSLDDVSKFLRSIDRKKAGEGLAHVAGGRSFEASVLSHCTRWMDKFRHVLPKGVQMSDVDPEAWTLQQTWLDAVLERWRRAVQKEAR